MRRHHDVVISFVVHLICAPYSVGAAEIEGAIIATGDAHPMGPRTREEQTLVYASSAISPGILRAIALRPRRTENPKATRDRQLLSRRKTSHRRKAVVRVRVRSRRECLIRSATFAVRLVRL